MTWVGPLGHTSCSHKLVRVGKLLFYHLFGDAGVHSSLGKQIATMWRARYVCPGLSVAVPQAYHGKMLQSNKLTSQSVFWWSLLPQHSHTYFCTVFFRNQW